MNKQIAELREAIKNCDPKSEPELMDELIGELQSLLPKKSLQKTISNSNEYKQYVVYAPATEEFINEIIDRYDFKNVCLRYYEKDAMHYKTLKQAQKAREQAIKINSQEYIIIEVEHSLKIVM